MNSKIKTESQKLTSKRSKNNLTTKISKSTHYKIDMKRYSNKRKMKFKMLHINIKPRPTSYEMKSITCGKRQLT